MVFESSAVSSPLCNNDTVKLVLAYLGRGAGLFAFANKSWKAAYAELTPAVRTSYSAVLASPACIKWAHTLSFRNAWNRKRTREGIQQVAGSCADLPALQSWACASHLLQYVVQCAVAVSPRSSGFTKSSTVSSLRAS
jgi:hypothetical protein